MNTNKQSARILIADDQLEVLNSTCVLLQQAGWEVITAQDGDEAVQMARENNPDVIVLDMRMPKKDGMAALEELQSTTATQHIPVIVLSASTAHRQAALSSGARFFVAKPYASKDLLGAIERCLSDRSPPSP